MQPHAPIAIACCRAVAGGPADELFPDPDSELLREKLVASGAGADLVSWDDPAVDWGARSIVVIRSTWDSVDRPAEYVAWAQRVSYESMLLNPADVVEWNLDKTYLEDLAGAGIAIIPTQWVHPGEEWVTPAGEYVVKPSISAGGRETARYGVGHDDEARLHVKRLGEVGQIAMVQPFLASVVSPGELSLIFIDGVFSHAVRKGSVLELGGGVVERPWERMTFLGLADPTSAQLRVSEHVVAAIDRRFNQRLVYSRVDLVDGPGGEPLVIEVEAIDPQLSLGLAPHAVSTFARALVARL